MKTVVLMVSLGLAIVAFGQPAGGGAQQPGGGGNNNTNNTAGGVNAGRGQGGLNGSRILNNGYTRGELSSFSAPMFGGRTLQAPLRRIDGGTNSTASGRAYLRLNSREGSFETGNAGGGGGNAGGGAQTGGGVQAGGGGAKGGAAKPGGGQGAGNGAGNSANGGANNGGGQQPGGIGGAPGGAGGAQPGGGRAGARIP